MEFRVGSRVPQGGFEVGEDLAVEVTARGCGRGMGGLVGERESGWGGGTLPRGRDVADGGCFEYGRCWSSGAAEASGCWGAGAGGSHGPGRSGSDAVEGLLLTGLFGEL